LAARAPGPAARRFVHCRIRPSSFRHARPVEPNAKFQVGADGETGDFKGFTLSNSSGAAWSLPLSNRGRERTPRRAALLCSPPRRSFALPGLWITLFSARSFFTFGVVGIFGAAERHWR